MQANIIFNDGTSIVVEQNANTFISITKPDFPDDLSVVTIESNGQFQNLYNVTVQKCAGIDDRYWFGFLEETEQQKTIRELREENELIAGAIMELAELIRGDE
jgi:hypothetical protein